MVPESTRAKDEKRSQLINEVPGQMCLQREFLFITALSKNVTLLIIFQRGPSPPIPTLQRKQKNVVISRPLSAVSELSSRDISHFLTYPSIIPCRLFFIFKVCTTFIPKYTSKNGKMKSNNVTMSMSFLKVGYLSPYQLGYT